MHLFTTAAEKSLHYLVKCRTLSSDQSYIPLSRKKWMHFRQATPQDNGNQLDLGN